MKLNELIEAKVEPSKWISDHWDQQMSGRSAGNVNTLIRDGKVFCDFVILDMTGTELPFEFADGIHTLSMRNATSLKGCPKTVDSFYVYQSSNLKSFEGAPEEIGLGLSAYNTRLVLGVESLKDIHNHIKKVNGEVTLYSNVERAILGLLKIDGITKITCSDFDGHDYRSPVLDKAAAIVNKYVGQGNAGLLKAQRELIEADLDDFAEM